MTDNQNGTAPQPSAPEPETPAAVPAAEAAPAPVDPATPAPAPAPIAAEAAPAPVTPPAAPAPAAPTGTVYTPGQAPQPYHAPQYTHQPSAAAQPSQPSAPVPPALGTFGAGAATATQPTEPLHGAPGSVPPGSVPPAFGGPAQPAADAPKPERRKVGFGVAAAIVATALVAGAGGAGITALVFDDRQPAATTAGGTPQNIVVNDADSVNQITAVAAAASPSVVTISVTGGQGAGTGSGVILSEDGYVLTNTHVVTLDGATGDPTIQVKTSDGKLWDAELVGTDPMSDLAVIKLVDASGLQAIEFADSDKLNVGDVAIAIGAPLGLSGTVTNGIVSALNRSIDVKSSAAPETPEGDEPQQQPESDSPYDFWNFDIPGQEGQGGQGQQQSQSGGTISIPVIQTDAAINPGNSGGALLNAKGQLIGINVAILSAGGSSGEAGNIGVGFAVPANLAERVSKEIIENGKATHGLLGASVTSAQSDESATEVGALISEIVPGGAAEQAGLKAGDVVTSFNGVPITDQTDLTAQVRALPGGSKAQITYTRDGKSESVDVTLGTFQG